MIIREKDFVGIKQLLQFKVIDDSLDLAKKLIDIGTNKNLTQVYPPAYDLGLMMLYRLKSWKEIAVLYAKRGDFLRMVEFAVSNRVTRIMKLSDLNSMIEKHYSQFSSAKKIRERRLLNRRLKTIKLVDEKEKVKNVRHKSLFIY